MCDWLRHPSLLLMSSSDWTQKVIRLHGYTSLAAHWNAINQTYRASSLFGRKQSAYLFWASPAGYIHTFPTQRFIQINSSRVGIEGIIQPP